MCINKFILCFNFCGFYSVSLIHFFYPFISFLAWWVWSEAYRILVVDAGFPGVVCRLQSVWASRGWCAGSSVCGLSRGGVQAQQLWNRLSGPVVCGILVPRPEIELVRPTLEGGFLVR